MISTSLSRLTESTHIVLLSFVVILIAIATTHGQAPGQVFSVGNYYGVFVGSQLNWHQADGYCRSRFGTRLASIHTLTQNTQAAQSVQGNVAWIGLHDLSAENQWRWLDNTPYNFARWLSGEPNNWQNEDCVHINWANRFSFWNDYECLNTHPWIVCNS